MDKSKKALIVVLVDLVMLFAVVVSVYFLIKYNPDTFVKNVLSVVIFLSIPIAFFVSFMGFGLDKYDDMEPPEDEDVPDEIKCPEDGVEACGSIDAEEENN